MNATDAVSPLPIGARVLIDRDGGPVPCEVIARDNLRGLVRMRMILPGRPRDGLTFWRPWDAPVLRVIDPAAGSGAWLGELAGEPTP